MKFAGRRELNPTYAGVRGENVTETHHSRAVEREAASDAQRLAVARYYLPEVSFDDVAPIGQSGRRFRVAGFEYELRLSEEYLYAGQDPREVGCVCFFQDGLGHVHLLRRPRGLDAGTGVWGAVFGGRVAGNVLIDSDGTTRPLR